MKNPWTIVLGLAAAVGLLLASVIAYVRITTPATPDPATLPSNTLESPAPAYADAVEEGRGIARSLISEEKLPGLSVAVAVHGDIVWAEGFRWADMETEAPVTPETLFRVAGVSKLLTAAAAGLLSQRGALDLDAPVQRYVPNFPEKQWPISARHLMAHTAGIRPLSGEAELIPWATCASDAERLARLADDSLRFRPGTNVAHSSGGWVILGAVVAAAAGDSYLEFLHREVLSPLGMRHTFPEIARDTVPGSAHFYWPRIALDPKLGLHDAPEVDLSCVLPASGFLSTPSDLVRLASAMMGDTLFDAATAAEFHAPIPLVSGAPSGQALWGATGEIPLGPAGTPIQVVGLGLGTAVHRSFLSASGSGGQISGGTSAVLTVPELGIAIAVASNVSAASNVAVLTVRLAEVFGGAVEAR